MKEYIIDIEYGGLGDNLFFTPLPRLLKEKDPKCSVLLKKSSNIRSSQIIELIWMTNPYLDGITEKQSLIKISKPNSSSERNIVSQIVNNFVTVDEKNLNPEIYFELKNIDYWKDKTVVDLNYVSFIGAISKIKINDFLKKETNIVFINKPKWVWENSFPSIKPSNLKEYSNIIYSSNRFICFTSGGATLASAIGKKAICIYGFGQNKIFHHSTIHEYIELSPSNLLYKYFLWCFLKSKNKLRYLFSKR